MHGAFDDQQFFLFFYFFREASLTRTNPRDAEGNKHRCVAVKFEGGESKTMIQRIGSTVREGL